MKVVLVDGKKYFPDFTMEEKFFAAQGIDFSAESVTDENDYIDKCKDADAILMIYENTPRAVIEKLENCKVMVRYGVGFDVIDVEAATEKGIAVCNVPDYCIPEVATHAIALALDCTRKITRCNNDMRKGIYKEPGGYPIHRLSNQTFGLVGFGNIARQTAKYASVFDCRVIAYDPYISQDVFDANHVENVSLEELCKTADIISIHVPLNEDTHHLINKTYFDMMKKGVIIVNTSRGGLINTEDLLDAVESGIIAASGLDVFETEPLTDPNARIFQYDNVITTSHIAVSSLESIGELRKRVLETTVKVLQGDLPYNVVNKNKLKNKRA